MDKDIVTTYRRCITCGKWLPEQDRIAERFCSRSCAEQYRRCPECGHYYLYRRQAEYQQLCPACGAELPADTNILEPTEE